MTKNIDDDKTPIEYARDYALRDCKIPDGKTFECANLSIIPLYIWILLKFKKTIINSDTVIHNEKEYKTVIYAKHIFGKVYIMKSEYYIDGKLISCGKLHRIEECISGFSAKMWTEDLI